MRWRVCRNNLHMREFANSGMQDVFGSEEPCLVIRYADTARSPVDLCCFLFQLSPIERFAFLHGPEKPIRVAENELRKRFPLVLSERHDRPRHSCSSCRIVHAWESKYIGGIHLFNSNRDGRI